MIFSNLLVLVLIGFIGHSMDATTFLHAAALQSTIEMYDAMGLHWIGTSRNIGHFVSGVCSLTTGAFLIVYGSRRKQDVQKFFSIAIGSQFVAAAALDLALVGVVETGGFWHVLALVTIIFKACSGFISTCIFLIYHQSLFENGRRHDLAVKEIHDIDSGDVALVEVRSPHKAE